MLTQAMPALVGALDGVLPPEALKQLTQALGNCNQPLTSRSQLNLQPQGPEKGRVFIDGPIYDPRLPPDYPPDYPPLFPESGPNQFFVDVPGWNGPGAWNMNNYAGNEFRFETPQYFNASNYYGGPTFNVGGNSFFDTINTTNINVSTINGRTVTARDGAQGPAGPPGADGRDEELLLALLAQIRRLDYVARGTLVFPRAEKIKPEGLIDVQGDPLVTLPNYTVPAQALTSTGTTAVTFSLPTYDIAGSIPLTESPSQTLAVAGTASIPDGITGAVTIAGQDIQLTTSSGTLPVTGSATVPTGVAGTITVGGTALVPTAVSGNITVSGTVATPTAVAGNITVSGSVGFPTQISGGITVSGTVVTPTAVAGNVTVSGTVVTPTAVSGDITVSGTVVTPTAVSGNVTVTLHGDVTLTGGITVGAIDNDSIAWNIEVPVYVFDPETCELSVSGSTTWAVTLPKFGVLTNDLGISSTLTATADHALTVNSATTDTLTIVADATHALTVNSATTDTLTITATADHALSVTSAATDTLTLNTSTDHGLYISNGGTVSLNIDATATHSLAVTNTSTATLTLEATASHSLAVTDSTNATVTVNGSATHGLYVDNSQTTSVSVAGTAPNMEVVAGSIAADFLLRLSGVAGQTPVTATVSATVPRLECVSHSLTLAQASTTERSFSIPTWGTEETVATPDGDATVNIHPPNVTYTFNGIFTDPVVKEVNVVPFRMDKIQVFAP